MTRLDEILLSCTIYREAAFARVDPLALQKYSALCKDVQPLQVAEDTVEKPSRRRPRK